MNSQDSSSSSSSSSNNADVVIESVMDVAADNPNIVSESESKTALRNHAADQDLLDCVRYGVVSAIGVVAVMMVGMVYISAATAVAVVHSSI